MLGTAHMILIQHIILYCSTTSANDKCAGYMHVVWWAVLHVSKGISRDFNVTQGDNYTPLKNQKQNQPNKMNELHEKTPYKLKNINHKLKTDRCTRNFNGTCMMHLCLYIEKVMDYRYIYRHPRSLYGLNEMDRTDSPWFVH